MDQYQFRSLVEAYQNVYQVEEVEDSHIDEEIDLYDVILNHLLDEGYCDDVESAEIIMANMSEEWLDNVLDEAFVDTFAHRVRSDKSEIDSPIKKAFNKATELDRSEPGSRRQKTQRRRVDHMEQQAISAIKSSREWDKKQKEFDDRIKADHHKDNAPKRIEALRDKQSLRRSFNVGKQNYRNDVRRQRNEELDLYDVVLDYLLDEGYCDDVESAEIIMANMSEEWRNEILEALDATDIKNREEVEKELRAYRTATPEQKKHIMARINERLPGGAGNQQNKPRTRRITYEVK